MMLPPGRRLRSRQSRGLPGYAQCSGLGFRHLDWLSQIEGSLANGKTVSGDGNTRCKLAGASGRGRTASMNGMYIASKAHPGCCGYKTVLQPAISRCYFCTSADKKLGLNSQQHHRQAQLAENVANKSELVPVVQQAPLGDKVISQGRKGRKNPEQTISQI